MIPGSAHTSRAQVAAALALAFVLCAASASAEVLVLRDGRRIAGKCHVSGKEVSVARAVTTSYVPRALIERVELLAEERDELDQLKRSSAMAGAAGHVGVAKWLDDHLQYEDATGAYRRAIEADADCAAARAALGYRRQGKEWVEDAAKQLARAMLGFGDASAAECVRLAKEYAGRNRPRQAETALRRALVANPEHREALALIQPYLAEYKPKNAYRPPLEGRTLAAEGMDHKLVAYMYNAIDFVKVDDAGRLVAAGDGRKLDDYLTYGAPVYAAAGGEVIAVVDGNPDTPIGRMGDFLKANSVAIRHAGSEFTLYAHLKAGTIAVRKGQTVKEGDLLGKIGNSGSSSTPHLHFCLYDADGISLPVKFTGN